MPDPTYPRPQSHGSITNRSRSDTYKVAKLDRLVELVGVVDHRAELPYELLVQDEVGMSFGSVRRSLGENLVVGLGLDRAVAVGTVELSHLVASL